MAASPVKPNGRLLNSWKEIASYLGRGVRTVQRYERDLSLPVRRPRGRSRSAVIALTDDIDAWLQRSPMQDNDAPQSANLTVVALTESRTTSSGLRARASQLRVEHHAVLCALVERVRTMTKSFGAER